MSCRVNDELWLNIPGYEQIYQIPRTGNVRRLNSNSGVHIVKSTRSSNGKLCISLWKDGERRCFMLHDLYMSAFHTSEKDTNRILYQGYYGSSNAKSNISTWLIEKIQECEKREFFGENCHDEILYLRSFLKEVS